MKKIGRVQINSMLIFGNNLKSNFLEILKTTVMVMNYSNEQLNYNHQLNNELCILEYDKNDVIF